MDKEEFKKKLNGFFSMLWSLFLLALVSSATFVAGYMLGLNRIAVPYLSNYIKVPEERKEVAATTTSASAAAKVDVDKFLKSSNPYTAAAMIDKFKRFKFAPFNEARFNFSGIFPVDWIPAPPKLHLDTGTLMDNLNAHKDVQIELAQIKGPGNKTALFQVWALNAPVDVDLDKFYRKYTAALNAEILGENPTTGGRKHALIRYKTDDGKTMIARSVAVRGGDYVFYMLAAAKENEFAPLSDMFNLAALSFSPDQGKDLEVFAVSLPETTGSAAIVE